MNLVRKYKIHQLSPCLNEKEIEIITFIENKIKGLKPIKKNKYPQSTFYVNSDSITILQQDDKNDRLRVRHKDFWEVLRTKYLIEYIDIQDIIRYMVFIHLKFRASIPQEGLSQEQYLMFIASTQNISIDTSKN